MIPSCNDTDAALDLLMELLYTGLSEERPSWYEPGPDAWRASLLQVVVDIEQWWRRFDFVAVDPQQRVCYIQRQQRTLLHCLQWMEQAEQEKGTDVVRGDAMRAVHRLHDFLLEHFETALRKDLRMPGWQQARLVSQLKTDLPALQKKLDTHPIAADLKGVIIELFIVFIEGAPNIRYLYGQALMMRTLMQFLLEPGLTAPNVIEQLCYLNCNSRAIYTFLRKHFDKTSLTLPEKTYRYGRLSKYFKRLPVKKGSFLEPEHMRLTRQLADYFADLARDARQQLRVSLQEAASGAATPNRLALRLTAEQLGLYIRLFKETEILQPVPTSQVIRFCVRYLRTVGKDAGEELSYEYLKSTISRQQPEGFTIVEKQLGQMMVLLRQWRIEMRKTKS
ncbi:MAG: hypothetical protein ACTHLE_15485 [Agriterribacter sp.]